MEEFSKGSAMSLLLELIVSLGIVMFLFWFFYFLKSVQRTAMRKF